MAYELKNKLLEIKPYYEAIQRSTEAIEQIDAQLNAAKSKIYETLPYEDYVPQQYYKAEQARQNAEFEKKKEKNTSPLKYVLIPLGFLIVYGLVILLFYSIMDTEGRSQTQVIVSAIISALIIGTVPGFFLSAMLSVVADSIHQKLHPVIFVADEVALEKARAQDEATQKEIDQKNAEYRKANQIAYDTLVADQAPIQALSLSTIDVNLTLADNILRLPEGYRTLAAVNEMLRRYEDCCEHLHGKDPTSIRQLIDFCKLTKCRENGESIMRQLKFDQQAKERQRQEDAHRRRMSEEWQTQSGLNQKTEELNRARKEIEEIKKELES